MDDEIIYSVQTLDDKAALAFAFFTDNVFHDLVVLGFSFITYCCVKLPTTDKLYRAKLFANSPEQHLRIT